MLLQRIVRECVCFRVTKLSGNDTAGNQRVNRENTSCYFELSTELLMNSATGLDNYVNSQLKHTECIVNTRSGSNYAGHMVPVGTGYGLRIEHILN